MDVRNLGPSPSQGGTVHYFLTGDVILGDLPGACTAASGGLRITCEIAALSVGEVDVIDAIQVIPQSPGTVSVLVRLVSALGDFDPDIGNNQISLSEFVEPSD